MSHVHGKFEHSRNENLTDYGPSQYNGPHTCPLVGVNKDGRMMDSNFLAQELHKYVLEDHTCKIKDLQNLMKERLQHEISYYKIWDAK